MYRTSKDWEQIVGIQIRRMRLQWDMSQKELALRSGVSKSALERLETGKGSTLSTLISVLCVLGNTQWLESLFPEPDISPIQLLESPKERQRASKVERYRYERID